MSQTAITLAFEQWKAQQAATGEPVLLDEFVFALVPGLDPDLPVDRSETLPPAAQIVHRESVTRKGVVNENAVVHSAVLGADVGDFSFNWIGLTNKATGTLAMIVHAPEQQKLKTKEGQQGNVLTRSFLMEFAGAQAETAINTPAETWQIDFTARMAGMDERQRLENIDLYGAGAFFDDGYLVGKSGTQYFVTKGTGYVAGLRAALATNQNITVTTKPVKVWLDVSWNGTLTSVWDVQQKITVAAAHADYVLDNIQHYVFALASIDTAGNITDLRPKGTLGDQQGDKSYLRKDANLSDVSDKAKSRESLGLGSAAVKDTGTSGNLIPLLSGGNTWSNTQSFTSAVNMASSASMPLTINSASPCILFSESDTGKKYYLVADGGSIRLQEDNTGTGVSVFSWNSGVFVIGGELRTNTPLAISYGGTGAKNATDARNNLGLKGSAVLDVGTTANTVAAGNDTRIVNALQKGNNLSELTNAATARSNLGLGSIATQNSNSVSITGGNATFTSFASQPLTISSGSPCLLFNETDTGQKYYLVADGSNIRLNQDGTAGAVVFSWDKASQALTSAGSVLPGNYSNFDARYQAKNTASKTGSGWFKDTSTGMIFQWGEVTIPTSTGATSSVVFTFPTTFPNAVASITATPARTGLTGSGNVGICAVSQATNTGGRIAIDSNRGEAISISQPVRYIAIGY